jgi:transcriptional regulator with XRE-family HTH domain
MAVGQSDDERKAFLQAFGLNLKLERTKRGLSQEEFADLIGVHRTFEGQLERGRRGVHISELPRIARVLGVKPGDLIPEKVNDHARSD